jgi:uncharacterized protein YcbX
MSRTMTVSRLSTTPVKGLGLHHPSHLDITPDGVVGDREFFLIEPSGDLISCTDIGDLMRVSASYDGASGTLTVHGPDGVLRSEAVVHGDAVTTDFYGLRTVPGRLVVGWDELVSEIGGRPLRLVHGDTGGFDVAGVTLLGAASTADLAARNGSDPVDGRRFRMTVEISGAAPHDEDTWEGRELRVGEAVLRVGGPVLRCAATTRNPGTGVVDLQTLRMIRTARGRQETPQFGSGFYFGVYAEAVTPGRIHLGDGVALVG